MMLKVIHHINMAMIKMEREREIESTTYKRMNSLTNLKFPSSFIFGVVLFTFKF